MRHSITLTGAVAILLFAIPFVHGQAPMRGLGGQPAEAMSYLTVMSGNFMPLSYKLQELDTTWRKMRLAAQGGGEPELALSAQLDPGFCVYYTRGQTVLIGNETYLVAYCPPAKPPSLRKAGTPAEIRPPDVLGPETVLSLSLLNVRTIGSILSIRPVEGVKNAVAPPPPVGENPPAGANPPPFAVVPPPPPPPPAPAVDTEKLQKLSLDNMRQLAMKIVLWAQDHNDNLPAMKDVTTLKGNLKAEDKLYLQPGSKDPYQFNSSLGGVRLDDIPAPAQMALVYEANGDADGKRAVVYLDGHGERVTDVKWEEIKKRSGITEPPAPAPAAAGGGALPAGQ